MSPALLALLPLLKAAPAAAIETINFLEKFGLVHPSWLPYFEEAKAFATKIQALAGDPLFSMLTNEAPPAA